MKRQPSITLTCERCGTHFTRRASYHRHLVEKRGVVGVFCGRACKSASEVKCDYKEIAADYLAGQSIAEIAGRLGVTCEPVRRRLLCQGIVLRTKTAHLYTSRNPTKGKGHSEATKEKLRRANAKQFSDPAARARHGLLTCKQIAEGRTGKTFNKLEERVAVLLTQEGHAFVQQHPVGSFVFDFYIAASNTLVESHGTFWHADDRFYDLASLSNIQQRNLVNDRRKATYAANHGYTLRVIREADVM